MTFKDSKNPFYWPPMHIFHLLLKLDIPRAILQIRIFDLLLLPPIFAAIIPLITIALIRFFLFFAYHVYIILMLQCTDHFLLKMLLVFFPVFPPLSYLNFPIKH